MGGVRAVCGGGGHFDALDCPGCREADQGSGAAHDHRTMTPRGVCWGRGGYDALTPWYGVP